MVLVVICGHIINPSSSRMCFSFPLLIKYNEIIMPAYFHVLRKKEHCVVQKKTFFSKTQ